MPASKRCATQKQQLFSILQSILEAGRLFLRDFLFNPIVDFDAPALDLVEK